MALYKLSKPAEYQVNFLTRSKQMQEEGYFELTMRKIAAKAFITNCQTK